MIWGILTLAMGAAAVVAVFIVPVYFIYQARRNNI